MLELQNQFLDINIYFKRLIDGFNNMVKRKPILWWLFLSLFLLNTNTSVASETELQLQMHL